jgi:hypothetical protein
VVHDSQSSQALTPAYVKFVGLVDEEKKERKGLANSKIELIALREM